MVTALIWSAGALDDIQGIASSSVVTRRTMHAAWVEGLLELGGLLQQIAEFFNVHDHAHPDGSGAFIQR